MESGMNVIASFADVEGVLDGISYVVDAAQDGHGALQIDGLTQEKRTRRGPAAAFSNMRPDDVTVASCGQHIAGESAAVSIALPARPDCASVWNRGCRKAGEGAGRRVVDANDAPEVDVVGSNNLQLKRGPPRHR